MFKALQPLLTERSIHILLSSTMDGRINVYVEPAKLIDKEDNAYVTPFRCTDTPDELDAHLSATIAQWVKTRASVTKSLSECLAEAEAASKAAAEEAKKKATERSTLKKPGTAKPVTPAKPAEKASVVTASPTPSLLDDLSTSPAAATGGASDENETGADNAEAATTAGSTASATPAVVVNATPDAICNGVCAAGAATEAPQAAFVASGSMTPASLFD